MNKNRTRTNAPIERFSVKEKSHKGRPKWGDQWDMQAMDYLMKLGPASFFRNALSKFALSKCLILGIGSEASLVSNFSNETIGINISREGLLSIMENRADLILGDARRLPFREACFDSVVCKSTLHHLPNLEGALQEMRRALRNKGYVILYEPSLLNPIALIARKFFPTDVHVRSERPFNPSVMKKMINSIFEIVDEGFFFLFCHTFPILGKYIKIFGKHRLLKIIYELDALLSRTFVRKLCWILIFVLKKDGYN